MATAAGFTKSDEQLLADQAFKELVSKYSVPSSKESLDKAVKSLQDKKHNVKVVENEAEALEFLKSLLKDGMSLGMGQSATLDEIGFIEYLKANDAKYNNLKGKAVAAMMTGNMADYGKYLGQMAGAEMFLSSVSALSEEGDFFCADLTGSRMSGWLAAGQLVVVLGSNKIVKDEAEAEKRLYEYQLKLESARVRVAYKVPASAVVNKLAIRSANPFGARTTVVIVKKSLGF